ncbi:MAG: energy transducer TonB [candidate division WOR-3 bacterium]|nr:MAG: energy transducer TonB [candidate division WOR-3 bacterium]
MTRPLLCLIGVAALVAAGCRKPEPEPKPMGPTQGAMPRSAPGPEQTEPELLSMPTAEYPEAAVQSGIEGRVIVEVTVDTAGAVVTAAVVESSGHPALDQSARRAALQAKFRPAMKDGVPVESRTNIPFGFWPK